MFGLISRLLVCISIPAFSLLQKANAAGIYNTAVSTYQNELILVLCGFLMVVGCLASIVTPDPEGVTPSNPAAKLVYSIFGSISALTYLVFYQKELSLAHALWVGGVSFVSPAIVPSLKGLVFDLLPIAMQTLKQIARKWMSNSGGNGNG